MGFYSFSKLEHSTRPRIALRRIWQKEEALEKLSQILHIGIIEILIKDSEEDVVNSMANGLTELLTRTALLETIKKLKR